MALDESLFKHESDGTKVWVGGIVETDNHKMRLDILPGRSAVTIKTFLKNHLIPGTTVTHDGWAGYSFFEDEDNTWPDETHNHGAGDFGYGLHSMSNVESIWSQLKNEIKFIYSIIPARNFIYYLREAEFRININKKSEEEKFNRFYRILKKVYFK